MRRYATIVLVGCSFICFAQESFREEIDRIYNFHPHKLKREEQEQLFPVLDKLFEKIESDTTKYLPLLRAELKSDGHFPYFYYDGSHLLMLLSKSRSDLETSASGFAKCNVEDLDPKVYVVLLQSLANDKIDITKAAIKILERRNFSFFVPQHAMNFVQAYCLTYCLLPLDPGLYVDSLIENFKTTKDIGAQMSVVTTLWFAHSCSGDQFLQSLNEGNSLTKEVAEYANTIMTDDGLGKEYKKSLMKMTVDELDEMRASALTRFSDEATYDLAAATKARRKRASCR